jgi:hypothetical protein
MTTSPLRPSGSDMVKGLAKYFAESGNRLRHGPEAKCVDANPSQNGRQLLPNDGMDFTGVGMQCPCAATSTGPKTESDYSEHVNLGGGPDSIFALLNMTRLLSGITASTGARTDA